MTSLADKIKLFNADRNPHLLPLKYQAMRTDAFTFYRGSCHVFYADLPPHSALYSSPFTWICGDLHLENFGCHKANNGAVYLNVNDFDEGILAPCLFDVARLLTSILLATDTLKIDTHTALELCEQFLTVYQQTLLTGKAQLLDEARATGTLKKFLAKAAQQERQAFVKSRSVKNADGERRLLIDDKRIFAVSPETQQQVSQVIEKWATTQPQPDFYQVMDVAGRIAGTGSLGLERYAVLLNGDGKGERCLLDMKIANPPCLQAVLKNPQPHWTNEAERIVSIQQRFQVFPIALLNRVAFKQHNFVIKEWQTSKNKVDLTEYVEKLDKLSTVISSFAALTAWNQLACSADKNAASVAELIAFAKSGAEWKPRVLAESKAYAAQTQDNYRHYCKAYDEGYFKS